jgi:hypothetical protein
MHCQCCVPVCCCSERCAVQHYAAQCKLALVLAVQRKHFSDAAAAAYCNTCMLLHSSNSAVIADAALHISVHNSAWSDSPAAKCDVACDVATAATDAHLNLIATVTQAETASEYSAR